MSPTSTSRRTLAPIALAIAIAATALGGCAIGYSGAARPTSAGAIAEEPGWVSAPVGEVRQRADNDCGPAALAMVAARWDRPLALAAITTAIAPTEKGARLGALRDFARAHGLRAFAVAGDRALLEHELGRGRPVIVGLIRPHGREARTHYEVVVAVHADGRVATVDPAAGWQVRPWAGLEAEWQPAGHPAMVVVGAAR
jgi:ABC-type bacteriocin/lantibiotic exporter with double-glycine peptidase domain